MKSPLKGAPADDLRDAIGQLNALGCAVHQTMLDSIAGFDEREGWAADGAGSMAAWLSFHFRISPCLAAQWVRVAAALQQLPAIRAAYGEGRLSWAEVEALTKVATGDTEGDLLVQTKGLSVGQLRNLVNRMQRVAASAAERSFAQRYLRFRWDGEDGSLLVHGRLAAPEGAAVVQALERLADQAPCDPVDCTYEPFEVRCADALTQLASAHLAKDGDPDRATVVVHTEPAALNGNDGMAGIDAGPPISLETARRIACDCLLEVVSEGPDGRPFGIGRRSRNIPRWLVRQLRHRDGGCRFPGCTHTRWLKGHHIKFWAEGGPTDRDNLLLLCARHHQSVHEGGWSVRGDPDRHLSFIRPDGRELNAQPPALRPEVRARFPALC